MEDNISIIQIGSLSLIFILGGLSIYLRFRWLREINTPILNTETDTASLADSISESFSNSICEKNPDIIVHTIDN